jgi:hypothetical protein
MARLRKPGRELVVGELDIPDRPTGRHAAVAVRGDVPAMPVVPSHTLYRGSPYLLVNSGQRYSLGWLSNAT